MPKEIKPFGYLHHNAPYKVRTKKEATTQCEVQHDPLQLDNSPLQMIKKPEGADITDEGFQELIKLALHPKQDLITVMVAAKKAAEDAEDDDLLAELNAPGTPPATDLSGSKEEKNENIVKWVKRRMEEDQKRQHKQRGRKVDERRFAFLRHNPEEDTADSSSVMEFENVVPSAKISRKDDTYDEGQQGQKRNHMSRYSSGGWSSPNPKIRHKRKKSSSTDPQDQNKFRLGESFDGGLKMLNIDEKLPSTRTTLKAVRRNKTRDRTMKTQTMPSPSTSALLRSANDLQFLVKICKDEVLKENPDVSPQILCQLVEERVFQAMQEPENTAINKKIQNWLKANHKFIYRPEKVGRDVKKMRYV